MTYHAKALLGEVMVDIGSFHGQVPWRVERVALILGGLVGSLAHREQVWGGVQRARFKTIQDKCH